MKNYKTITYRCFDRPAIILEGKFLSKKYGLNIGDKVGVEYGKDFITLKVNSQKYDNLRYMQSEN